MAGAESGGAPPLPPELTWAAEPGTGQATQAIWGSGPDDIYAVGALGTVLHFSEGEWRQEFVDTSAILTGVWGSGPDDVYITVNANIILHKRDGGSWERETFDQGLTFRTVWGTGADDVFACASIMFHKGSDGVWKEQTGMGNANAIWGSGPTNVYAVANFGNTPTIFHTTGDGVWKRQPMTPMESVRDISGVDAEHIFAAGTRTIYFSRGDGNWIPQFTIEDDAFNAIWVADRETVYACTQKGMVYRSNGAGDWSGPQPTNPGGISRDCYDVWGTGPDNVYAATTGGVYRGTLPK